jgi:hypothetical protein
MNPTTRPLCWPEHIKRARLRARSSFGRKERAAHGGTRMRSLRFTEAERELLDELDRLKATHVVVSSNVVTRGSLGDIHDPGVAVFFRRRGQAQVIACDQYTTAADNAYAIAKTIEALRAIERHGSATLGDQAFSAFKELPAGAGDAPRVRHWREVLGVPDNVDRAVQLDLAEMYYRRSVAKAHPDRGGTHEAMQELNGAIARAREELR